MEYLTYIFVATSIVFLMIFGLITARLNRLEGWYKALGEYCNYLENAVIRQCEINNKIIESLKITNEVLQKEHMKGGK